MKSSAKVYQRTGSPYFMAWFLVWNARRQKWVPKTQTTKCTDPAKALEIARGYERLAQAAGGPSGSTRLSRDFIFGVVNSILTLSGHEEVVDTKTLGELAADYLARFQTPANKHTSSHNTFRAGLRLFTKHVPDAESTPINAFTKKTLQDWYDRMIESGRKASTVNSSLQLVSRIFEAAREEGYCARNPAKLVQKDKRPATKRQVFEPEEIQTLIDYFKSRPQLREWLTVFLLGICTAQRLGDCARAMFSQFSEKEGFLVWACTPRKTQKQNKTLEIPIVAPLLPHLRELIAAPRESLFLAPTLAQTRAQGITGLSSQFIAHLSAAGVQEVIIDGTGQGNSFRTKTFHSLRHTCNSLMANAGVPVDVRQRITGHTTASMNQIYTHIALQTSADALGKGLASTPKPPPAPAQAAIA